MPTPEGSQPRDFPGCVVLPGLINTHAHVELHGLKGQPRSADFFAWIRGIRSAKDEYTADEFLDAAKDGVRDMWRWGITTIADTGTSGATVPALSELGGRGRYYHEAITPDPARVDRVFDDLVADVASLRAAAADAVEVGVSPHAPYSVQESLYRKVLAFAAAESLPVAGHLAESPLETSFVRDGNGPFAASWRERGFPLPARRRSAVELVSDFGMLGPRTLAIHLAQADETDLAQLAAADVAVACCPRSNRAHGHGDPPLAAMLDADLRVGLGTDSAASVDTADILAEARCASEIAGLTPEQALGLVTHGAARALGMERRVGSLTPGRAADITVVDLTDVHARAWAGSVLDEAARVVATLVGGQFVYVDGEVTR